MILLVLLGYDGMIPAYSKIEIRSLPEIRKVFEVINTKLFSYWRSES